MTAVLEDIRGVVRDGLCTGCGTCAGVCPANAVTMRILNGLFLPEIKEDECVGCHLCLECCSGCSLDFEKLNSEVFGKQPDDFTIGNFLECYLGHSADYEIRRNSSSGGIVSHLLIFALEKGLIDGALVVRMNEKKPLEPLPFIARTGKEIVSASKSKYCPVALNVALKEILAEDGKYAVVGLPCHIHGIRKAESNIKGLKEKIVLHIGLFCSHTVNFFGTDLLLRKFGVKQEQLDRIDYRGFGWPGFMFIRLKDGSSLLIPYVGGWNAYWPIFSSFFFTPMRCLMCPDEANELADISVGDAWLPELKEERNGESVIVARTREGEKILNIAASSGAIFLKPVECEKVKHSQAEPLRFKKDDLGVRLALIKSSRMKIPDINGEKVSSFSISSFARNLFVLFNMQASENKFLRRFMIFVPFPIFRLYYGVYKFLSLV